LGAVGNLFFIAPNGYGFKQWGLQAQKFNRSDKKKENNFLGMDFNSII
jgi:hypothetical protein